MIIVEDLHVTFNPGSPLERRAVRGVGLTLGEGEFATVIGSNGAGKSTLLAAIAGDVIPQKGHIRIGERDVTREAPAKRAARVARVFQDPLAGSCADLSIEENLALAAMRGSRRGFGLALRAERRKLLRERVAELGLGLEGRMGDRMGLLSGGQRQAVAIARTRLSDAKLVLMDEPTAAISVRQVAEVLDLIRRLKDHGVAVILISHRMPDVFSVCDRVVVLRRGRKVADKPVAASSPEEVTALITGAKEAA